ncbi:gamma subclass chorismate mutase AroQ [Pandoraea anapnoica]|uniref:gamma subclass chorismate mutase AroQ n=1 Tax=Pandoraea anapnoica TaxID=2508301 RepID=UPI0015828CF2|nr:gamma subclass chorismate mutase AroQ [Pandoraea anapnoica]
MFVASTLLGLSAATHMAYANPALGTENAEPSLAEPNTGLLPSHTLAAAPHGVRGFAVRLVSQAMAGSPAHPSREAKARPVVDPVLDPLMNGILKRLAISEAVARNKYGSGKAVQDTAREQALLDSMGEQAPQYGLTPAQARTFFRLQIDAGKLVQTALLARWARDGHAPGEPVDLGTRLRPALDKLGMSLLHDLGRLCALPDDPTRLARIHQARERIAHAAKLEALQRAAFDEATSGLCLSAPPRIWTLSMAATAP